MGRKKQYISIPKIVAIICRTCGKISRRAPPKNGSPQFYCDKCGQRMTTPVASCCIICAFSDKKCPAALIMEAKVRRLEIRY